MSTHNQTTGDDTHQTVEETNPTTRVSNLPPPPPPADEQRRVSDSLITHDRHDQTLNPHAAIAEGSTALMSNAEIFNQLSTLVNTIGSMAARVENIERETQTLQNSYEQQAFEIGRPRPATQNRHRPGKEPIIEQAAKQGRSAGRHLHPTGNEDGERRFRTITPRRLTYSTTSGRPLPVGTRSRGPSRDQARRRNSRETWDKEGPTRNPITERGDQVDEGTKG